MNKDIAIKNIKDSLKRLMKFSSEMKYQDLPLQDGTMLCIEDGADIEVGTPIYQSSTDGTTTPVEDGSYQLSDGRTIVVAKGLIESIADADPSQGDAEAASPESDANVQSAKVSMDANQQAAPTGATNTEDGNSEDQRISNLEAQVAEILEVLQSLTNMQEQTMSKVETFASAPAEESYKAVKTAATSNAFKNKKFQSDLDELKEIRNKFNLNQTNRGALTMSKGSMK